jgi:single-strand DNA-binding protein
VIVSGRLRSRSWENPEGETRSAVEIEADEVGPSLRWATAKVEKQSRSGGGGDWGESSGTPEEASVEA